MQGYWDVSPLRTDFARVSAPLSAGDACRRVECRTAVLRVNADKQNSRRKPQMPFIFSALPVTHKGKWPTLSQVERVAEKPSHMEIQHERDLTLVMSRQEITHISEGPFASGPDDADRSSLTLLIQYR